MRTRYLFELCLRNAIWANSYQMLKKANMLIRSFNSRIKSYNIWSTLTIFFQRHVYNKSLQNRFQLNSYLHYDSENLTAFKPASWPILYQVEFFQYAQHLEVFVSFPCLSNNPCSHLVFHRRFYDKDEMESVACLCFSFNCLGTNGKCRVDWSRSSDAAHQDNYT